MLIPLFISGVMALYLSFHIYSSFFSNKLIFPVLIVIVFIILLSVIWLRIISNFFPYYVFKIIQFIVYFLMGIGAYLFIFYIISDVLRLFININPKTEGIIIIISAIIISFVGYLNTRLIREVNYTIYNDKITKPLKVALISDIHMGSPDMTISKFKTMINKVNSKNVDFIIIAGDIVDDASVPYQEIGYGKLFKDFKAKQGVYATIGNHETYMGNVKDVETKFINDGLNVLNNSQKFFKDYNLNLIGIEDTGRSGIKPKTAKDFNLSKNNFNLVIEHNPIRFNDNYKDNIDLQVSGHTHGGQMIIGYIMELFMYTKPWGRLDLDNSTLITSSGVGSWGPPIRDITYPEVVIINIEPVKK